MNFTQQDVTGTSYGSKKEMELDINKFTMSSADALKLSNLIAERKDPSLTISLWGPQEQKFKEFNDLFGFTVPNGVNMNETEAFTVTLDHLKAYMESKLSLIYNPGKDTATFVTAVVLASLTALLKYDVRIDSELPKMATVKALLGGTSSGKYSTFAAMSQSIHSSSAKDVSGDDLKSLGFFASIVAGLTYRLSRDEDFSMRLYRKIGAEPLNTFYAACSKNGKHNVLTRLDRIKSSDPALWNKIPLAREVVAALSRTPVGRTGWSSTPFGNAIKSNSLAFQKVSIDLGKIVGAGVKDFGKFTEEQQKFYLSEYLSKSRQYRRFLGQGSDSGGFGAIKF